jgi:hypothetical protein
LHALRLKRVNDEFALEGDALQSRIAWRIASSA